MTLHSDHGNARDAIASKKKNHDRQKTEWASRQWPGHDRHKKYVDDSDSIFCLVYLPQRE